MVPGMDDQIDWKESALAVVDVETTGLDPEQDRVIEVGIIHMRGGSVEDRYSTLVNPGRDLPAEVVKLTGISPEDVETAPPFEEIADKVCSLLEDRIFVAYNLAFDRAFLQSELGRVDRQWDEPRCIDPLIFVRELHRNQGSKRLAAVAERLGIDPGNSHRAADDAEVAGKVLYSLAEHLPERLDELLMLQSQWERQQDNEMAGWRGGRRTSAIDASVGDGTLADRGNSLGPAYVYGEDTDPVRAMFVHLPDSGSRRVTGG